MAEITFFKQSSHREQGEGDRPEPRFALKRRLLDLGLTRDTVVEAVQKSPAGDPIAYLVRGCDRAVPSGRPTCFCPCNRYTPPTTEVYRMYIKADRPCNESTENRANDPGKVIALAGNPNVGKSTVFNALTGMKQHTELGRETVVNVQGRYTHNGESFRMVDLPGTYSPAHSAEEEVARDYICFGDADAVIVVCDATCLERNSTSSCRRLRSPARWWCAST